MPDLLNKCDLSPRLKRRKPLLWLGLTGLVLLGQISPLAAQDQKFQYSTNETGVIGLNTIPSARMDSVGTARIGMGTSDPYVHAFIGFQIAEPLYINVRNTIQASSLTGNPDDFLPALDFKLRLMEEDTYRPALVLGMDSAFGDKRTASEYFALSKRIGNFDLTGGVAWGRLGSAGHFSNPLTKISSHFDQTRKFNSFFPQEPNDWFTGEDIGLFGGIEYFTPVEGLSIKADYGANDYIVEETNIDGFDAPAPWALSVNYKPWEQIDLSAGIIGGDKFMARLSLQDQLGDLPLRRHGKLKAPTLFSPRRDEADENIDYSVLNLKTHHPTAKQILHQAVHLANTSNADDEDLSIDLRHRGLHGATVKLVRGDIEDALLYQNKSPDEIWRNAEFTFPKDPKGTLKEALYKNPFSKKNKDRSKHPQYFKFVLENKLSISESFVGNVYRSSALIEAEKDWTYGLVTGGGMRFNLADNLDRIEPFRLPTLQGVRSDEPAFAEQRVAIDRLYVGLLSNTRKNLYTSLVGGYLEEMYAGGGGEMLYRPFGKTYAIGADAWYAYKRDPDSTMNIKFSDKSVATGHLNLYYEVPNTDFTAYAKAGKYLGGDVGGTVGLKNRFSNGASVEGFITATDLPFEDILGNKTHIRGGVRLSLPLGNIPFVPDGSELRLNTGPLARVSGQTLERPLKLYDVTEPIAYRQISQSWPHLLD